VKKRLTPIAVIAGAVALASTLLVVASAAAQGERAIGGYNLSGVWTNSDGAGTTLTLRQTGHLITWVGGPNNHAWTQNFSGVLEEENETFSGTFWQDAPGVSPQRYHGEMKAQVDDSCHFTLTSITQAGQPTLRNVLFTKTPCTLTTAPAKRLQLNVFNHRFVPATPKMKASCPAVNECVVANNTPVTFCNRNEFRYAPFTLDSSNLFRRRSGSKPPSVRLRPDQCFTHRFVNKGKAPIVVKIFDEFHPSMRFLVTVMA
jgi:hypothetical protein